LKREDAKMKFSCYGDRAKPAVLLMHGMCQDWHSMYEFLGDLEKDYYLIIPAMDGFYEGSAEWIFRIVRKLFWKDTATVRWFTPTGRSLLT